MPVDVNLIRDSYLFIIAPEFVTTDTQKLAIINSNISFSSEDVNSDVFGEKTNRAIALLTAHNLTYTNALNLTSTVSNTPSGSLTRVKKKIDKVETEYQYSGSLSTRSTLYDSPYSNTKYGIMFQALLDSCKVTGAFIV